MKGEEEGGFRKHEGWMRGGMENVGKFKGYWRRKKNVEELREG